MRIRKKGLKRIKVKDLKPALPVKLANLNPNNMDLRIIATIKDETYELEVKGITYDTIDEIVTLICEARNE